MNLNSMSLHKFQQLNCLEKWHNGGLKFAFGAPK